MQIMENGIIAIPSKGNGGLDGRRSGHFGHCDVFTLVEVKDGRIAGERILANQPHASGGCMAPVAALAAEGVKAIVVGGIGKRPLMGFQEKGIEVFFDSEREEIRPVIEDLVAGKLPRIHDDQVCSGGGNCHGHQH
jgi:predicted Fe-Mo cluster-binding NifX family protein